MCLGISWEMQGPGPHVYVQGLAQLVRAWHQSCLDILWKLLQRCHIITF